jgi:hypothetical protein
MIFENLKAPIYLLDGVAAHKAGEWPGLKSSKFMPTRKNIRPKDNIIFHGGKKILRKYKKFLKNFKKIDDLPIQPRRRVVSLEPSKEYVFRPSCKMTDISQHNLPK